MRSSSFRHNPTLGDDAVGRRLAHLRRIRAVPQGLLAKALGRTQTRISAVETGACRLLFTEACAIADLLGVPLAALDPRQPLDEPWTALDPERHEPAHGHEVAAARRLDRQAAPIRICIDESVLDVEIVASGATGLGRPEIKAIARGGELFGWRLTFDDPQRAAVSPAHLTALPRWATFPRDAA